MKFAMITTYATPTNIRRELLESISRAGHEVTVIAPENASTMQPGLAEFGARYIEWRVGRIAIAPRADLASARHLVEILRRERPDVVLIYQVKAVLIAPVAARLARVPHIVALVNGLGAVFDDHGFGLTWKARLARRIYSLSLRGAHRIVFQNPDDPVLLAQLGVLPSNADWRVVDGTGVNLTKLKASPPWLSPPTFTLMSRLLGSKGIREYVTAAREVRASHPEVRFRLVGQLEISGHPDGIRQDEIDGWVGEGLIEYLGFARDIASVLSETTAFVLPSYYREGIPRTNLEAMALGRALITTDWVGCRETVVDGVNGIMIPVRDVRAIVVAMQRYLESPELVARHGRESRRLVEARFDIDKVNVAMLDALGLARGT